MVLVGLIYNNNDDEHLARQTLEQQCSRWWRPTKSTVLSNIDAFV